MKINNFFARFKKDLAMQIFLAMVLAVIVGLVGKFLPIELNKVLSSIFGAGGDIFLNLMKMIIVPIVFVSLVTGICSLKNNLAGLRRLTIKSIFAFILTTAFAVFVGVSIASLFHLGAHGTFTLSTVAPAVDQTSLRDLLVNFIPSNPIKALADGNMLQIIVFAIIFGLAIVFAGEAGNKVTTFFESLNVVVMKMVLMLMKFAPYGVFCLIASLFEKFGINLLEQLLGYFVLATVSLICYTLVVYGLLLRIFSGLNPRKFFRKMYGVLLFAFSVSSSNATLPLTLETAKEKLGVSNKIASFVIPLGTNMNKNGTALVLGMAAVFIANIYHVHLSLMSEIIIVFTTTLAAIGTAGAPSSGIFIFAMVLNQVGLPLEGIGIIFGIDRFLDMVRTSVNVAGNAMLSCVIGKSEGELDLDVYNKN